MRNIQFAEPDRAEPHLDVCAMLGRQLRHAGPARLESAGRPGMRVLGIGGMKVHVRGEVDAIDLLFSPEGPACRSRLAASPTSRRTRRVPRRASRGSRPKAFFIVGAMIPLLGQFRAPCPADHPRHSFGRPAAGQDASAHLGLTELRLLAARVARSQASENSSPPPRVRPRTTAMLMTGDLLSLMTRSVQVELADSSPPSENPWP